MRGTVITISFVRSSDTVHNLAVNSLRPVVVSAEFMTSVMNLVHQNIYYLCLERFGPEAETWVIRRVTQTTCLSPFVPI
jgi:hypothetical protein